MNSTLRVAIAQINSPLTYCCTSGSYLENPVIYKKGETSLIELPSIDIVRKLRSEIQNYNLSNTQKKLIAILKFCKVNAIDLVVFPEYSIPVQLLEICYRYSKETQSVVIAGSHSVVNNHQSKTIYENCELMNDSKLGNIYSMDEAIRMAMCPIFSPNGCFATWKMGQSKWESELSISNHWELIRIDYPGFSYNMAVLLCIDSLTEENRKKLYAENFEDADILVIPACSPSIDPFRDVASFQLINEKPTLFCNMSYYGGSKIYANQEHGGLYLNNTGTVQLGKFEAIVGADLNLTGQSIKKGTVRTCFNIKPLCYSPLLYETDNPVCNNFIKDPNIGTTSDTPVFIDSIEKYLDLSKNIPQMLLDNLAKVYDMSLRGMATQDERLMLTKVVPLGETILNPEDLSLSLMKHSLEGISSNFERFSDYSQKSTVLAYMQTVTEKQHILYSLGHKDQTLYLDERQKFTEEEFPSEIKIKFEDRGRAFTELSSFINSSKKIFYLDGIKGIGKTSFVEEFFNRKLSNIKPIWITATQGTSFNKIFTLICKKLEISLDPQNINRSIIEVVINSLKSIKIIIFDQIQFLLLRDNSFRDHKLEKFLQDIINKTKIKLILINDFPNIELPEQFKPVTHKYTLHKIMDNSYISRIIESTLRSMDLIKGIETPRIPAKLFDIIDGYPLAAIICCTIAPNHSFEEIISDKHLYLLFKEKIINYLLQKNTLSDSENEILFYTSLFNEPVPVDFFYFLKGSDTNFFNSIDKLEHFCLIQKKDLKYVIHPLIQDYFLKTIDIEKRKTYHSVIADYFLKLTKDNDLISSPTNLISFIYHASNAQMELEKNEILAVYKDELRPAALFTYRNRNYPVSISYYSLLVEYDDSDWDAHFHLALANCKKSDPDLEIAEFHLNKTIEQKKIWWIYNSYANAVMRHSIQAAEYYVNLAFDLAPKEPQVLVTIGKIQIRFSNGKYEKGMQLFNQAIKERPQRIQTYIDIARFLTLREELTEAIYFVEKGLSVDPINEELINLKELLNENNSIEQQSVALFENDDEDIAIE